MTQVPDDLITWANDNVSRRTQQIQFKQAIINEYDNLIKQIETLKKLYEKLQN